MNHDWSASHSRALYNLAHWGEGYFDINDRGHLVVYPRRTATAGGVDLYELTGRLAGHKLACPVVVRFTDILADRVDTLCGAFHKAMDDYGFRGKYTLVYPIKVNQHHTVVNEILRHGGQRVGLEAGSKPELLAVMANMPAAGGLVICNGYKDQEYIRLASIGQQLGMQTYIVIEKVSELKLILKEYQASGVKPLLGIRLRLASAGEGKWQNSGGEKSKFGLSASQTLEVVEQLRQHGLLDCLRLLHFHLGSQLPNIRSIQAGLRECSQFYAEMLAMNIPIDYIDVGGGLGIDYEGTRSRSYYSRNYSVEEYARNVVHAIWDTCEQRGLPHPNIISESGRALTAHHAVLITNVIDIDPAGGTASIAAPGDAAPPALSDLYQLRQAMLEAAANPSPLEAYHDAVYCLSQLQEMYTHGVITLQHRAQAEELYLAICRQVQGRLQSNIKAHRELLDELNEKLADKYFLNLSIFQSLPDIWAIDQIFPIVPLHRLLEKPQRRGILQDITCDSDGRVDSYVDGEGLESSLPLHGFDHGQPYLLAVFLAGAYQEILGDMHNLFGDTDSITVSLDGRGGYELSQPMQGDTVDSVLRFVKYDAEQLMDSFRAKVAAARLPEERSAAILADLHTGLTGYTYLEE